MILRRLVEFTERLPDIPPPGYQPAFITKRITLNADGTLRDVVPLSGDKRGKREGLIITVPREQPQRTVGTVPRLIADNANYALGKIREKDKPEQVFARHKAFVDLVGECAESTQENSVKAISSWLTSGGAEQLRDRDDIAEDDDLTFQVGNESPTDLPSVRAFWASKIASEAQGTCLVTGRPGPIVDRMPIPIKGIPDGQVSGTALISVNNDAGMSFGLNAAFNSPISAYAAEAVCNGLNYLLASERHALRVGKTVFVYWTRGAEAFSWNLLKDPSPEDVTSLLESANMGRKSENLEVKDFFALALSANASRIVVRQQFELTLSEVKTDLASWFKRLEIVQPDGGVPKPFGVYRLSTALFRESKDMPAHVPVALLRCALTGARLPDYLLGLAIKRNLAMQGPFSMFNRQRYLSVERLALIKAILEQTEKQPLSALNLHHPDSAYHCGRLLALLERIQRTALGDINSTVVDRYYGAACTSPGSILGNLVNDSQSHLAKMRKDRGDGWAQAALGEVLGAVGDEFPKTLSLHRQGLFALGFYHQKASDRAAAADAKAKKDADQGANQ